MDILKLINDIPNWIKFILALLPIIISLFGLYSTFLNLNSIEKKLIDYKSRTASSFVGFLFFVILTFVAVISLSLVITILLQKFNKPLNIQMFTFNIQYLGIMSLIIFAKFMDDFSNSSSKIIFNEKYILLNEIKPEIYSFSLINNENKLVLFSLDDIKNGKFEKKIGSNSINHKFINYMILFYIQIYSLLLFSVALENKIMISEVLFLIPVLVIFLYLSKQIIRFFKNIKNNISKIWSFIKKIFIYIKNFFTTI